MNSKLFPHTNLLLLVFTFMLFGDSRFHQIMDYSDYDNYYKESRNISVEIEPFTNIVKPKEVDVWDNLVDTVYNPQKRLIIGISSYNKREFFINDILKKHILSIGFYVNRYNSVYSMHGGKIKNDSICLNGICISSGSSMTRFDRIDTTTWFVGLHGNYNGMYKKYLTYNKYDFHSHFISVNTNTNFKIGHKKKEKFEPPLPDSLIRDKFVIRNTGAYSKGIVEISTGIGRQVNQSYKIEALEIEKILKKCGTANFEISKKTINKLSDLLANNNSYKLRNSDRYKKFKIELDSVLSEDVSISKDKLINIPPFELRRLMFRDLNPLMTGPELSIYTKVKYNGVGLFASLKYPYDKNNLVDTSGTDSYFLHTEILGLKFNYGIVVTNRWYLSATFEKNIFTSKKGFDLSSRVDSYAFLHQIGDNNINLYSHFRITPRIVTLIGMENLYSLFFIPNQKPFRTFAEVNFFIEEYFTLNLQTSFYNSDLYDNSYISNIDNHDKLSGIVANIAVTYNF